MKRAVQLGLVAIATLSLSFPVAADAASRLTPTSLSEKVSAKVKGSKAKLKVTGTLKLPPVKICRNGSTNPAYCLTLPKSSVCTGKVKLTFKKGSKKIGSATATLKSNCTYTKSKNLSASKARGTVKTTAKFSGNPFFNAKSKSTKKKVKKG